MIWLLIIIIVGLAVAVGYLLLSRQRNDPPHATITHAASAHTSSEHAASARPAPSDRRYWGKQFIVLEADQACPEARALHGHCFAYGKAPPVPLKGCGNTGCTCHFRDLDERRSGQERRTGQERREQVRFEELKERRVGKDRRGDHYDWRFTA
ncbi:MAG: hypothetical protein WC474_02155 [Hydrogenophilaceae bacterium]